MPVGKRPAMLPPADGYAHEGVIEERAMETWLSLLDTDLRAIGQRRMTAAQRKRFEALLERAYTDCRGRRKPRRMA